MFSLQLIIHLASASFKHAEQKERICAAWSKFAQIAVDGDALRPLAEHGEGGAGAKLVEMGAIFLFFSLSNHYYPTNRSFVWQNFLRDGMLLFDTLKPSFILGFCSNVSRRCVQFSVFDCACGKNIWLHSSWCALMCTWWYRFMHHITFPVPGMEYAMMWDKIPVSMLDLRL